LFTIFTIILVSVFYSMYVVMKVLVFFPGRIFAFLFKLGTDFYLVSGLIESSYIVLLTVQLFISEFCLLRYLTIFDHAFNKAKPCIRLILLGGYSHSHKNNSNHNLTKKMIHPILWIPIWNEWENNDKINLG
jgi:hypothetical protein